MKDTIKKAITSTIVNGFELVNNVPQPVTLEIEGRMSQERVEGFIRRNYKNQVLVAGVTYAKTYYELDTVKALENATSEKKNADDITLGESFTRVDFFKLAYVDGENGEKVATTVKDSIVLSGAMLQERAFGAARRATDYDIIPFASEQTRAKSYITREKFFELASKCDAPTDETVNENADTENDEN